MWQWISSYFGNKDDSTLNSIDTCSGSYDELCKKTEHINTLNNYYEILKEQCEFQVGNFIKIKDYLYCHNKATVSKNDILYIVGVINSTNDKHIELGLRKNIKVIMVKKNISCETDSYNDKIIFVDCGDYLHYETIDSRMFTRLSEKELNNIPNKIMQLFTNFINDNSEDNIQEKSLVRFRGGYNLLIDKCRHKSDSLMLPMLVIDINNDIVTIAIKNKYGNIEEFECDKILLCFYK